MSDEIHRALIHSLLACLVFLEQAGDEEVDPDSAVRALEHAAHPLLSLAAADRRRLVTMFREVAAAESDGDWRAFILDQPFGLGLLPHDDDARRR